MTIGIRRPINDPEWRGPRAQRGARLFARADAKEATATLTIYDSIGGSWGGISSKDVAAELAKLKSAKALNVYLNSPGGEVFEGIGIYTQLDRFPGQVTVYVDGLAGSIASIIAMAGDKIVTAPNAQWMIHDPWGMSVGTADDMRAAAEMLDKTRQTLVDTYAKRTKQDPKQISEWMTAETWMNAAEAKARGFTDEVTNEETVSTQAMGEFTLLAEFKHTPNELKPAIGTTPNHARLAEAKAYLLRKRNGASTDTPRDGQPERREISNQKDTP